MKIRLNLLPHREQKRQARKRQFISLMIGVAVLGLGVVVLVHLVMAARIDNQQSRNQLLKAEIAKLDQQIKEIDRLREATQALLARKEIVETLQANRTEGVHLLDQIVRVLPEGVYLRSVKQVDRRVTLVGFAQSNARVSTLMRNIEGSTWLERPSLVEIKSVQTPGGKANEFTLNFQLRRAAPPAAGTSTTPAAPSTGTAPAPGRSSAPAAAPAPPEGPVPAPLPAKKAAAVGRDGVFA